MPVLSATLNRIRANAHGVLGICDNQWGGDMLRSYDQSICALLARLHWPM